MSWKRARSPEQKEERRQAFLRAAAEVLEQEGADATGVNAIARNAGFSKANLYRYFSSREEILLHLLLEDLESWSQDVERESMALAGCDDPKQVAQLLVRTIITRPRLLSLTASLARVLDHDVPTEVAVWFREQIRDRIIHVGKCIQSALPSMAPSAVRHFQDAFRYVITGMWPSNNPEYPAQSSARFAAELERILIALLRGYSQDSETLP